MLHTVHLLMLAALGIVARPFNAIRWWRSR